MSVPEFYLNSQECQSLDDESIAFLQRVFAGGLKRYEKRIKAIGFVDMTIVLDAGCGFGQWSLALSRHNQAVWGIDVAEDRVRCAAGIAEGNNIQNVRFKCSVLEELDIPDKYFDAIFCYSTFHHTDETKVLSEFSRLIKPGGLLYLNFNDLGWFLHLFWERGVRGGDQYSLKRSLQAIMNFLLGRTVGYHVVRVSRIKHRLKEFGFDVLAIDGDGQIKVANESVDVPSFYDKYYYGFPGVWETLAQKTDLE